MSAGAMPCLHLVSLCRHVDMFIQTLLPGAKPAHAPLCSQSRSAHGQSSVTEGIAVTVYSSTSDPDWRGRHTLARAL